MELDVTRLVTRRALLAAGGALAAATALGGQVSAQGNSYRHTFKSGALTVAGSGDIARLTVIIDGSDTLDASLSMVIRKGTGPIGDTDLLLPHVSRGVWSVNRDPGASGLWWAQVVINTESSGLDPADVRCTFQLLRGGKVVVALDGFAHKLAVVA